MISNVALQTTDPASTTPAAGDTGDTGAFDALLALQSLVDAQSATAANAQTASSLEGAELLAGALDEPVDEAGDDDETGDDASWFLASLLPVTKMTQPAVTTGSAGSAQPEDMTAATAGAAPKAAAQSGVMLDLAQALITGAPDADAVLPVSLPSSPAAAPIDTSVWNSLTGPAEMFAQAARHGTAERVESTPLTTHVRDPRWVDELGHRLASMVRTGESSASLQLTPVDLGPLEVNIAVRDNQATVHFAAANAETRALLEASMPRLREMLESQGFALMDSSVSHGFAKSARHESAGTPRVDDTGETPAVAARTIHITGLLDLYA